MKNFLPALDDQQPLDYHTSLGIFGLLLSLEQNHKFSIQGYYDLVRLALENKRCFVALNDQQQPLGALIWLKCDIQLIEELQLSGWQEERQLQVLLKKHQRQGEHYLLLHINSPFGQQLELINAWQQYVQNTQAPCWALADKDNSSLRKLC